MMTYPDKSGHILTNNDISCRFVIKILKKNVVAETRNQDIFSRELLITCLSIAFEDVLASLITPQVLPQWQKGTSITIAMIIKDSNTVLLILFSQWSPSSQIQNAIAVLKTGTNQLIGIRVNVQEYDSRRIDSPTNKNLQLHLSNTGNSSLHELIVSDTFDKNHIVFVLMKANIYQYMYSVLLNCKISTICCCHFPPRG